MLTPLLQHYVEASQNALACKPPYRGRVQMSHFDGFTLITAEINGIIERRWFLDESPIYHHYLDSSIRRRLVAQMYKSGFKASEIAELIGVNDSTISADLKHLRQNDPDSLEPQMKAADGTPPDRVLKSTTNQKPINAALAVSNWV
ncbi:winged helix-turn-helix domain-containing protein [Paraburkholderia sp. BCC1886]|uniref:winged helix-turn-helix domain-containing protein n=1 Tax=Paraburkholderia sp. BCC1886 TaxID=2562670 RepID=UPI001182AC0A|nr:winged helix-turn-helix domain-containing protein [Paraburkholderia sp. BCC1886]